MVPHDDMRNRPWALQAPPSSGSSRAPRTLAGVRGLAAGRGASGISGQPPLQLGRPHPNFLGLFSCQQWDESLTPENTPSAHSRLQKLVVTFHQGRTGPWTLPRFSEVAFWPRREHGQRALEAVLGTSHSWQSLGRGSEPESGGDLKK